MRKGTVCLPQRMDLTAFCRREAQRLESEGFKGQMKTHLLFLVEGRVECWPLVVAQLFWLLVNVLRRREEPSFGDGHVLLQVGYRGVHGVVKRLGSSSPVKEDAICCARLRISERTGESRAPKLTLNLPRDVEDEGLLVSPQSIAA